MALTLLAWDNTNNRIKRTSSAAPVFKAQSASLTNGTTSVSVTFSSAMTDANYALTVTMKNTTDTNVLLQPVVITFQDANGFVAKWNSPLDSTNYLLSYIAIAYS